MRLLLVEDDRALAELLRQSLTEQHYAVDVVNDGVAGWEYGSSFAYDAIVLDIMLPKLDGISLCRQLRDRGFQTPILLLTARDSSTDKVRGLDAGADDYVVKPFDVEELTARIRALLRRENQTLPPVLQWGQLRLNPNTLAVSYGDTPLSLTPKEYALLELFLRHEQRTFSLSEIIDQLWTLAESPGEDTVRTHVKGLRHKLKEVGVSPDLIETVYGIGYRLKPLPGADESPARSPAPSPAQSEQRSRHLAAIAKAWEKCKGQLFTRLEVLEEAAQILQEEPLDRDHQQEAQREAHTLAGTLGTFGLGEGSRLAREIEQLLRQESHPEQGVQLAQLVSALRKVMEGMHQSSPFPVPAQKSSLLLILDDDAEFTQQLSEIATTQKLRTTIVANVAQAKTRMAQALPDIVLVKLSFSESDLDWMEQSQRLALIEELSHHTLPITSLVVANGGTLENRLEVARRGGRAFLEQPITAAQAIDCAIALLKSRGIGAKILVVDSDTQWLASLPRLFKPWQFEIATLKDPQQFWTGLNAIAPDVVILELELPQISGIELCQILRNDPRWHHLPILLLSTNPDPKTQEQAFASGADDYLIKPIESTQLANRILNRLSH